MIPSYNILGVMSGKGGVGKTFIASNLAVLLAKQGKKVGLLDADICCPNIFSILGITSKIHPTADKKIIPAEKYGIKAVSMEGLCNSQDEPLAWRGTIVSRILQQLLRETIWGDLDILIVDFPTGTSDSALTILQHFDTKGVLLVTTPQRLVMTDVIRTLSACTHLKIPILGVLENMRGEVFGEGGASYIAERYRIPMLGSIPMRKQISSLCDQGIPAILHMEELELIFTKILKTIGERIMV